VRISPFGQLNDVHDNDTSALFTHVARRLHLEGIAYIHVMEPRAGAGVILPAGAGPARPMTSLIRSVFEGVVVATGGFDAMDASQSVQAGAADAIGFGRAFIVHPDLPARLKRGEQIETADPAQLFVRAGSVMRRV
jgi:N-ethylmaleimide reductase